MRKTLLTVVATMALLVVAACGDDADDTAGSDGTAATDAGTDADTGAGFDGEVTIGDDGRLQLADCEGDPAAAPGDGVTEDTVNVAALSIDWAPLADIGFAASDRDPTEVFEVFAEEYNDDGGVCGRSFDVQRVTFDVLAGQGGQACVEATEDRDNLSVYTYAYVEILCLTDAGVPVFSGNDLTAEEMAQGGGILFTRNPSVEDQYRATVQYALGDGALEGKVGVWYGTIYPESTDAVEDVVLPMLDDAGVDYVAYRTDSAGPQDPEGNAILTAAATGLASEEVDTVLMFVQSTNQVGMQLELDAQGLAPRYISMPISGNAVNELWAERFGTTEIADGQQFVTFSYSYPELDDSDPIAAACHEIWTRRTGEEVPRNTFDFTTIALTCTQVDVLAAATSLAGGDLTRERFVEALASLPPYGAPPWLAPVAWSQEDRFGPATFSVQDYDGDRNLSVTRDDRFEVQP